jgi:hypothetical protein
MIVLLDDGHIPYIFPARKTLLADILEDQGIVVGYFES